MDPNAALAQASQLISDVDDAVERQDVDAAVESWGELKETAYALDEWLSNGGFLPTRWAR